MSLFRSKAEQKLIDKGLDPARLPPGQYLTEKWPVLHAGTVPQTYLATWDFKVFGEVDEPITLSYDELQALPTTEITTTSTASRVSRFGMSFQGVHWRESSSSGRSRARASCSHAEQGFTANVPLAALETTTADRLGGDGNRSGRPRLATATRRPFAVLLEERQVAARHRTSRCRPTRLLGALRLSQRRRLLEGTAVQLLS
jgi:hypothetical protein